MNLRKAIATARAEMNTLGPPLPSSYDVSMEDIEGGAVLMCDDRIFAVAQLEEESLIVLWPEPKVLGRFPFPKKHKNVLFTYILGFWEGVNVAAPDTIRRESRREIPPEPAPLVEEKVLKPDSDVTPSSLLIPFII